MRVFFSLKTHGKHVMGVGVDLRLSAEGSLTLKDREQRPVSLSGTLQSCNPSSFETINYVECGSML